MMKPTKSKKRCFVICPNPAIDILATVSTIESKIPNRVLEEIRFPGGKGIHVALALAELAIPCTLIGLWGIENGNWLKDACESHQPAIEVIGPHVDGWNRSCYAFQSESEWQDTELLGVGPTMTNEHFADLLNIIESRNEEIHSLAICGSWPNGALSDYNRRLVERCNQFNISVFLDCTGPQLTNALLAKPFFVHLNRREITTQFQKDFKNAQMELLQYCELIAITDGANGLFLNSKGREMHANVNIKDVKSTIGSGDCLVGGIMMAHYFNMDLHDVAKYGVACGAANCIHHQLGMLQKGDVETLFNQAVAKLQNN